MKTLSSSSFPLDLNVNVSIKVLNGKGEISQHVQQHNKATVNMTKGIVKFLRGEFTNTNLSDGTVGYDADSAKNYIPAYIGIGNIGTVNGVSDTPAYEDSDYAQYLDQSLRNEIFKYFADSNGNRENHRFKIERSTCGDSSLSDTFSLKLSSKINFSDKFLFYDNYKIEPISFIENVSTGDKADKIIITEIGLFSGDVDDYNSKLLARMLLSEDSPIIIDSTSTVIINWIIGVYSIDDQLLRKEFNDYEYAEKEQIFTEIVLEEE